MYTKLAGRLLGCEILCRPIGKVEIRKMSEATNGFTNGFSSKRGALIVLEGCDRVGKTTQCKRLVNLLNDNGHKAMYINFPARDTPCGSLINAYLTNKQDMSDESIHLLFTLNRWEAKNKMQKLLLDGTSLVVDRYSYSGVAFSAAKGLDLEWCKAPEKGLLKPDVVVFLSLTSEAMARRGGFGDERYENTDFQKKVLSVYQNLIDENYWRVVDADKTEDDLLHNLNSMVVKIIDNLGQKPLDVMW